MKKNLLFTLILFLNNILIAQNIELYGKFEVDVNTSTDYENPYDYDEVAVTAVFTAPDGEQVDVDGFFIEDFDLNITTGGLAPLGEGFKVRFSPYQIGIWNYEISKIDSTGKVTILSSSFECIASNNDDNHGFVKKNNSNYLNFDDGEQYIPIGENMAWQTGNTVVDYTGWLTRLSEFGGNFIRLWHAHWGLGIEWKDNSTFDGLKRYQQTKSRYLDWLFDYCDEKDVYVMLCLQHHGQVSSNVNPNWNDSPYNIVNGGPCQNTWDFFTDSTAIAHTKNRLRYIVARWGYSRNVMAWELFNEVDWTDNFSTHKSKVADWHFEMTDYLKTIDPYGHLITTSYAKDNNDPDVWSYPEIDISQTHYYNDVSNLERVLAAGATTYLKDFGKPTLIGEFGLGGSVDLVKDDEDGIFIHNSIWGGLMGGGMGTGMTWWWNSYIHPNDLYFHFQGVQQFSKYVSFIEKNLAPSPSLVLGSSGDLELTPTVSWGVIASDSIHIDELGQVSPDGISLSQYLYGSQWNTQFRSPPSFHVNYANDGYFQVMTSNSSGQGPHIAIYLDSVEIFLDTVATTNFTYEIDIPAGEHIITVDNTGTDWISIAGYKFSDLGKGVDSYVLTSEDKDYAVGWVLNSQYNHDNVLANGVPAPATDITVIIPEFQQGNYFVTWLDCLSGEILNSESIIVSSDSLEILVPEVLWDAAFVIDKEEIVSIFDLEETSFTVYPNPVNADGVINLEGLSQYEDLNVSLIDISGRNIHDFNVGGNVLYKSTLTLSIPNNLTSGMYWVKVRSKSGKIMARPIMVKND